MANEEVPLWAAQLDKKLDCLFGMMTMLGAAIEDDLVGEEFDQLVSEYERLNSEVHDG